MSSTLLALRGSESFSLSLSLSLSLFPLLSSLLSNLSPYSLALFLFCSVTAQELVELSLKRQQRSTNLCLSYGDVLTESRREVVAMSIPILFLSVNPN
jgi:hypothetical protein